jgi:monoamine oxidase
MDTDASAWDASAWDTSDWTADAGVTAADDCLSRTRKVSVAVVGGGLAGLMAARTLADWGMAVTVYEARAQVGGRVLSDTTFARGRVIELGAELIGSIHTLWCALARHYGIALVTRTEAGFSRGQQLTQRMILDRELTPDEVVRVQEDMVEKALHPMAQFAENRIKGGTESHPWTDTTLADLDRTTVAQALERQFRIPPGSMLWRALELFLVNNNVSRLETMNYLALLCLIRGGQRSTWNGRPATVAKDPLMGYWDELEIYRCADGCQRMARELAADVAGRSGCRVLTGRGVRRIHLAPGGGVWVTARPTGASRLDEWLREKLPENPVTDARRFDHVVLAIPPTTWGHVQITPRHPGDVIEQIGWGAAAKFFSRVQNRFWIKDGFAPLGGSLEIGQVWEGTDNQTLISGQDVVLNVFTGARALSEKQYRDGLARLYPANPARPKDSGYERNLTGKPLLVNWARQPFIEIGYSSPRVGQVFTVSKELNEPFAGRMFFAGEHTQIDHFGYMEGALRSGERAARQIVARVCGSLEMVA